MIDDRVEADDLAMTVPQIAAEFGVSAKTIREAAKLGWVNARKVGRNWFIKRRDAVQRWGDNE